MTKFHSDEYVKFLRSIRPDNMSEYNKQLQKCTFYWAIIFCLPCWQELLQGLKAKKLQIITHNENN